MSTPCYNGNSFFRVRNDIWGTNIVTNVNVFRYSGIFLDKQKSYHLKHCIFVYLFG